MTHIVVYGKEEKILWEIHNLVPEIKIERKCLIWDLSFDQEDADILFDDVHLLKREFLAIREYTFHFYIVILSISVEVICNAKLSPLSVHLNFLEMPNGPDILQIYVMNPMYSHVVQPNICLFHILLLYEG